MSYNALGQPVRVVHADESETPVVTVTEYDERGLPQALSRTDGELSSVLAHIDRNLAGVATTRASGFGQGQTWSYDSLGRVTDHRARACPAIGATDLASSRQCAESGAVPLGGETLRYYPSGNLATLAEPINGVEFGFSYDFQHQLSSVTTVQSGLTSVAYEADFAYTPGGRLLSARVASDNTSPDVWPRDVEYDYQASAKSITTTTPASACGPTRCRRMASRRG